MVTGRSASAGAGDRDCPVHARDFAVGTSDEGSVVVRSPSAAGPRQRDRRCAGSGACGLNLRSAVQINAMITGRSVSTSPLKPDVPCLGDNGGIV